MAQIQFIQSTPDEVTNNIVKRVKEELSDLKEHFQPKEPTEYLTRNEVKELFKVDLSTVHNWTKKGKLQSYGIGHRVYYKRHEIDEVLTPLNS